MPATARVCIGNRFAVIEAVLILATTVQRFRLERVEDRPCAARRWRSVPKRPFG
ncbi:MAG TPA: cytochrome P450 [Microvirga sp.]|nr:cytochrome P450 [Microvirga sp.]